MSTPRPLTAVQRVAALALTGLAMAELIVASRYPWVSLHFGFVADGTDRVAESYDLGRLSAAGLTSRMYAGWIATVVIIILGVRLAKRQPRLLGLAAVVLAFLGMQILNLEQNVVRVSGLASRYPRTELDAGAKHALVGLGLVAVALVILAVPARDPGETAGAGQPVPGLAAGGAGPTPAAATAPTGLDGQDRPDSWSTRPAVPPWWHRRGPRAATVAGIAAVVLLLAGGSAWLATHRPQNNPDRLKQLLLAPPAGSQPRPLPNDTLDVTEAVRLRGTSPDLMLRTGFRGVAARSWYTGVGTEAYATVVLLEFDSADIATQVAAVGISNMDPTAPNSVVNEVPGVPGAKVYRQPPTAVGTMYRVSTVARRDTVVILIEQIRSEPPDLAEINDLTRRQYEKL